MTAQQIDRIQDWLSMWVQTRIKDHEADWSTHSEWSLATPGFPSVKFCVDIRSGRERKKGCRLSFTRWFFQPVLTPERLCEILDRKSERYRAQYGYPEPNAGLFLPLPEGKQTQIAAFFSKNSAEPEAIRWVGWVTYPIPEWVLAAVRSSPKQLGFAVWNGDSLHLWGGKGLETTEPGDMNHEVVREPEAVVASH